MGRPLTRFLLVLAIMLIALTLTAMITIPRIMIRPMIELHVDYARTYEPGEHELKDGSQLAAEHLRLESGDGIFLSAYHVAHPEPRGIVIFLTGIHNPSVTAFYGHSAMLHDAGFSSLLLEVRAHGGSGGDLIGLGYSEIADVAAAIGHIRSTPSYEAAPVILFGLSMGGAIAINSAALLDEVAGVISLSAYSSFSDAFCDNMAEMGFPGLYNRVQKLFIDSYLAGRYGRDLMYRTPVNLIGRIEAPMLLMHSRGDSQVPHAGFERLVEAARPHVETHLVDGDLHFILPDAGILRPYEHPWYKGVIVTYLDAHFPGRREEAQPS